MFEFFLDAAERSQRLINVHTTGAESEVLDALEGRRLPAVIVHWYSGPLDLLDRYLDLGVYFTVGVELLRSKRIQKLASRIPAGRLLTETDNPGGWKWMTGDVGFPDLIEKVESRLAEVRGVPRPELAQQVVANFSTVLGKGGVRSIVADSSP